MRGTCNVHSTIQVVSHQPLQHHETDPDHDPVQLEVLQATLTGGPQLSFLVYKYIADSLSQLSHNHIKIVTSEINITARYTYPSISFISNTLLTCL